MGPDFEILDGAGMTGWYWLSVGAIPLFSILVVVATFFVSTVIPVIATQKYNAKLEAELGPEGLKTPRWYQTEKELEADGFKKKHLPSGEDLFTRTVPPGSKARSGVVETVIRSKRTTLAVADVIAVEALGSWVYGADDKMKDGDTERELINAIGGSSVGDKIIEARAALADVIGIGLESYPTDEGEKPLVTPKYQSEGTLSKRRSVELASRLSSTVTFFDEGARIYYWALDLGRASDSSVKDTAEEIRQRAAVVVAMSRRQNVTEQLSLEKAIGIIVTDVSVLGTDLSKYQYSREPEKHLETREYWDGGTRRPDNARPK